MRKKYNGPESPVLHTKVNVNRSTGSKEEDVKGFYHIWMRKPFGHVAKIILTYFQFFDKNKYIQNLVKKGQVISEKNKL